MKKITEILDGKLRLVWFDTPQLFHLIPRRLFEQVRDQEYNIDRIYQFGPGAITDILTYFFVMIDPEDNQIHGLLWTTVDCFTEELCVNVLSVDKEYQQDGIMPELMAFTSNMVKDLGLSPKIRMRTNRPRPYERYGWIRDETVEMTWNTNGEKDEQPIQESEHESTAGSDTNKGTARVTGPVD